MDFNMNDFMFQIQAILDVDINKLRKQLEGSMNELQNTIDIDTKLSLDVKGATEAIKTVGDVLSKLDNTVATIQNGLNSLDVNVDTSSAQKKLEDLGSGKVKLKVDETEVVKTVESAKKTLTITSVKDGQVNKQLVDAKKITAEYEKVKGVIEHIKKTQLSSQLMGIVGDKTIGLTKEDGSILTVFDKLANQDGNFKDVVNALSEIEIGLQKGTMNAEELERSLKNLKKISLAASEANEAFSLNSVSATHNSTVDKSDQTALYKERKQLMQEEERLKQRLISLNNVQNSEEIANITKQIKAIDKKREAIESEISSRNLTGAFFEKDLSMYKDKSKDELSHKLTKEADAQAQAIDKNIRKLEELKQTLQNQKTTSLTLSEQEKQKIDLTTASINSQIEALKQAKQIKVTGDTSTDEGYKSDLSNIQALGEQNAKTKELITSTQALSQELRKIEASNNAYSKMQKDADSVILKTRQMEEAIRKAFSQYGSNIDKSKLDQALASTMKTRQEAEKLKGIQIGDFNAQTATNKMNTLNTSIKDVKLNMTSTINEAQRWNSSFNQIFDVGKIMAFTAQFMFLRQAINLVAKEVMMVDSAMMTLKLTTTGTEKTFDSMLQKTKLLAKETGSTYSGALEVLKTYVNATDTLEETMQKIKPSMILSNISDISVGDSVDAIQAISSQFGLIEKASGDAEKASLRVTDSIISISRTLKMDFGKGVGEIADGIKASGSVMEEAGMSMERYAAQVAAVIENTRLAGSQGLPIYRNINIKNFVNAIA